MQIEDRFLNNFISNLEDIKNILRHCDEELFENIIMLKKVENNELEKYLLEYTLFLADIEKFDTNLIFEKSKKNSRIRGPLILYLALFFENSELKDVFYKYPCIMIECDKVKNAYYLNKPMDKIYEKVLKSYNSYLIRKEKW